MNEPDVPHGGVALRDRTATFTLRSRNATRIELCLLETINETRASRHSGARHRETRRIELDRVTNDVFQATVQDIDPGQLYGYRVDGPWQPTAGHRFDHRKLLVDPCAGAIQGRLEIQSTEFGPRGDMARDAFSATPLGGDTLGHVPLSVVVDDVFDWQGVEPRCPTLNELAAGCIYEAHVRGMTMRHPDVPEDLRGTYLGLVHPAVITHLQSLGVTAVQLMPVAHSESESHLQARGLTNYWGYSPLGFCAPDARFATGDGRQSTEMRTMVREFHRAGIAVLLDVVLNHTVEGDAAGPTVSLRGIDNASYYRHESGTGQPVDYTGCGNTLDFSNELVVDLAIHTLSVWARDYRVDGFRFDLATTLGRNRPEFDPEHNFFKRLTADPLLSSRCLIAEPWDLGPNGYALGRFPEGWAEWNDHYRKAIRAVWRGDGRSSEELLQRVAGSPDLLPPRSDGLSRSINYVTSHDGFTLDDLVSYEHKHNLTNGEDNRDGSNDNQSSNWGIEGPTDDPIVLHRRSQAKRGMTAMLALSGAIPMVLHGDELGRTQEGNNNAYCQDNETSWIQWQLDSNAEKHLEFVRAVFRLRRRWHERFGGVRAAAMHGPSSAPRDKEHELHSGQPLHRGVIHLSSSPGANEQEKGSSPALMLFNAHADFGKLELPAGDFGSSWRVELTTAPDINVGDEFSPSTSHLEMPPFSIVILERRSRDLAKPASRA